MDSSSEVFLTYQFSVVHQGIFMISNFQGTVNSKWNYRNNKENKNNHYSWTHFECVASTIALVSVRKRSVLNKCVYYFHSFQIFYIPFSEEQIRFCVCSVVLYILLPLAVRHLNMIMERPCLYANREQNIIHISKCHKDNFVPLFFFPILAHEIYSRNWIISYENIVYFIIGHS